jgi:hypothetical protein
MIAEDRMERLKLIIYAAAIVAGAQAWAPAGFAQTGDAVDQDSARLIRPRTDQSHPAHAHLGPLDERCKPLKDQLEAELARSPKSSRAFQARLAHNAGARLCREGRSDKGLAELARGLSYLQDEQH